MEINGAKVCDNCFEVIKSEPCPYCGYAKKSYKTTVSELPVGIVVKNRYHIGRVLGKGGFGVTYKAYDDKEKCLVALKEYYPNGMVHRNTGDKNITLSNTTMADDFKSGAEKFFDEAKTVSRFNGNPNIVGVKDFFYDNGTVYYAMEYLEGMDLKHYIKKAGGKLSQENVLKIVNTIGDALLIAHSMNVLHRDISPDNIYVLRNGDVKLIDFGAARQLMSSQSQSLSVILKQGFAPIEQYQRKGKQGPWTDIYALGATMFYALTGKTPEDATERLDSPELGTADEYGVDEALWKIIEKAMAVKRDDRYQSIMEMKADLNALSIGEKPLAPIEEKIENSIGGSSENAGSTYKSGKGSSGNETVLMDNGGSRAGETVLFDQPVTGSGDGKGKEGFAGFIKSHLKAVIAAAAVLVLAIVLVVVLVNVNKDDSDLTADNDTVEDESGTDEGTEDEDTDEDSDSEDGDDEDADKDGEDSESDEGESYTDDVIFSANTAAVDDVMMFQYDHRLYHAAIEEDGNLSDIKADERSDLSVYTIASDDEFVYMETRNGLVRMPKGGEGEEKKLTDDFFIYGFYIYDGMIYYINIDKVYAIDRDGNEKYVIAEDVYDYAVTEEGVYYTNKSNEFCRANLDGGSKTTIEKVGEEANVFAVGSTVFAWSDKVYSYDIETGECEKFSQQDFPEDKNIIAWDNSIIYMGRDSDTFRFELDTEKKVKISGYIPGGNYCTVHENMFYKNVGDSITIIDLENNTEIGEIDLTRFSAENAGEDGGKDVEKADGEKPPKDDSQSEKPDKDKSSGEEFNITKGLTSNSSDGGAFVQSDYFCLYLNADDYLNGLWGWKSFTKDSIYFYYAKAGGADRTDNGIMTIKAYDWGDNGYADYEDYQIAGKSSDKKYVVIFPEVKYRTSDESMQQEYNRLMEYAHRINANSEEQGANPFSCFE